MRIGNDVVDLRLSHTRGKARDHRFVERVFTPREITHIARSADPDRALWICWAGKEAAFKIARQLDQRAIFAHAAYEVTPTMCTPAGDTPPSIQCAHGHVQLRGVRELDDVRFALQWVVTTDFVHCIAVDGGTEADPIWARVATLEELHRGSDPSTFSARERESARSVESRAVRHLARLLAHEIGIGTAEIVRAAAETAFAPPRLYRAGAAEPLHGWGVSLSHDGGFAAAALCRTASGA